MIYEHVPVWLRAIVLLIWIVVWGFVIYGRGKNACKWKRMLLLILLLIVILIVIL